MIPVCVNRSCQLAFHPVQWETDRCFWVYFMGKLKLFRLSLLRPSVWFQGKSMTICGSMHEPSSMFPTFHQACLIKLCWPWFTTVHRDAQKGRCVCRGPMCRRISLLETISAEKKKEGQVWGRHFEYLSEWKSKQHKAGVADLRRFITLLLPLLQFDLMN